MKTIDVKLTTIYKVLFFATIIGYGFIFWDNIVAYLVFIASVQFISILYLDSAIHNYQYKITLPNFLRTGKGKKNNHE